MDIVYVDLGVLNLDTAGQAKMEARRNLRYLVHGRRSRRPRYLKPGVKKKACKVMVDRVKKSYGALRITT
jgi:hypothetical protein